ncbi:LysR family transcriptional regulator [Methyloligella sp. 2.7D]|uniref:LysR family transcriptional regulator n=1 Tax=unclassified Methyloligella TaxID=2625955 RepID=UPI00157CE764|nr:LysR family transcriptional regulator [Methyloligella sp. GL2]QKP78298.1 LysR family transcriptional regulator [Methyloligella sp. GL2]
MHPNEMLWRRLDWNLIRLFHEIVQHGGVTAAAKNLGRQQPATSQALSRLEDQLGVTLCERGPAGFSVTPEGQIVYEIASEMVELMRRAPDLLAQTAGTVRGQLRIVIMTQIVDRAFDEVLQAMARRHPLLEITIETAPWQSILEQVRVGDADIGLSYVQMLDQVLTYEPLSSETQQLYCAAAHPLYGQSFDNPRNLAGEYFFLTGRDEPLELANYRRQFELGKRSRGGSEDLGELKRLILTGAAIGFLPTRVAEPEVRGKKLWPLLSCALLPTYPVYMVTRPMPNRSLPAQLTLDEARRRLRATGPAMA